jgi:hypothetical protein
VTKKLDLQENKPLGPDGLEVLMKKMRVFGNGLQDQNKEQYFGMAMLMELHLILLFGTLMNLINLVEYLKIMLILLLQELEFLARGMIYLMLENLADLISQKVI